MILKSRRLLNVCLAAFVLSLIGCYTEEPSSRLISFYTDIERGDEDSSVLLLVNDEPVGLLDNVLLGATCGDSLLLNYSVYNEESISIAVAQDSAHTIDLGEINLFSVSQGISIRSDYDGAIYVKQDIDDSCTRVRLRW